MMNDIYWSEEIRIREDKRRAKQWLAFCYILFFSYTGMIFIEALFYGGEMRTAVITFLVALPLSVVPTITYLKQLNMTRMPMFVAIATNFIFLIFGTYLQELNYYFLVMFLTLGTVMVMKSFRMLAWAAGITFIVTLLYIIFVTPYLQWLNHYHFVTEFLFFTFGTVFYLLLTYSVDTKETGSERALAAFTALLNCTPNLMAITDKQRKVFYLSENFLKFIGYPRKEYTVGQPLIDLISDRRLKMIFAEMLDADGFSETEIDLDIDGSLRHFKVTTDKLSGGFDGMFIDISDITLIVQGRLAAEEANKSKSSFLATMSHEIRTPLNAIIGITQIQLQKDDLPDEYAVSFENINIAGGNLLAIINDILDMSKIEAGNLKLSTTRYDIASLIYDAVQLNIIRIGSKPVKFILDIDETVPSAILGDELRLKQILNNLLSNAVKYTDEGEIRLSVTSLPTAGRIQLTFIVSDTGQGMKPEDRAKLFEEQYIRFNAEANRTTEGTGLGLNITKSLVEMMDGTITVESEYGKGSTFTVNVIQGSVDAPPIGAQTAASLKQFEYADSRYKERRKTIRYPMPYGKVMVVDDSASNLFVAKGLLLPYKLKIDTAESGFEVIEKVKNGAVYDIIFMDHMMPRMDGIETTKKLREAGYDGTIVALTANALMGNDDMFTKNGFDGYISKPIDTRRFDDVLNKFIRDRHPEEAEFHRTENVSHSVQTNISKALNQIFRREAERAVSILRETVSNGDIKLFTTTVHAMKSALANVGQQELSAQAYKLEQAGHGDDNTYITENAGSFITKLEKLAADMKDDNNYIQITDAEDKDLLQEQLSLIISACENYDDTAVFAALDWLAVHPWSRETADKLEDIRNAVFLDSDFEQAGSIAGELAKQDITNN